MKIKHKIIGLTSLSLFALFVIVIITEVANLALLKLEDTLVHTKEVEITLLRMNQLELEYLLYELPEVADSFHTHSNHLSQSVDKLYNQYVDLDVTISLLDNVKKDMEQYTQSFSEMSTTTSSNLSQRSELANEMKSIFKKTMATFFEIEGEIKTAIKESQAKIEIFIVVALVLTAIVVATFSLFIYRSISSSLSKLETTMSNICKDNDLSLRVEILGNDELSTVSQQFNTLLASTQSMIQIVQTTIDELSVTTNQLERTSHSTDSSLKQQQIETDSVATAMTEMGESINEVATTTEYAANKAEAGYIVANLGLTEIQHTQLSITELSNELQSANDEVMDLSSLSAQISSVLDVIKEIAEQTNLLALNAAIEAARAGEQGRGFAVVADEVRTLAGRTQNSTEEINAIIHSVQEQTKRVVNTIGQCSDKVVKSVSSSEEASIQIQKMMEEMQQILDNSTQIAAAVQQQSAVADEAARNINAIRDITQANVCSVADNAQSSEHLAVKAKDLKQAISQFRV